MATRVKSKYDLTPVSEVINMIRSQAEVLKPAEVAFEDALGRVLASDVIAPDDLPPFPASIKVCPHKRRMTAPPATPS